jgi:hypothetical protein
MLVIQATSYDIDKLVLEFLTEHRHTGVISKTSLTQKLEHKLTDSVFPKTVQAVWGAHPAFCPKGTKFFPLVKAAGA